jgi:hypothetical protein
LLDLAQDLAREKGAARSAATATRTATPTAIADERRARERRELADLVDEALRSS